MGEYYKQILILFIILITAFVFSSNINSQLNTKRCGFFSSTFKGTSLTYFGAKYEPPDGRVIHGLGQYVSGLYTDAENWQYVTEYQEAINEIPVIYSVYTFIDPSLNTKYGVDFQHYIDNPISPQLYVLNIGLCLFDSTSVAIGALNIPVQTILSGSWDAQIINIAQQIRQINGPVYFRPGFEFGINNAGAHADPSVGPGDFINLWIYIYNIFNQQNVTNVAWVWNTVNPQDFNYLEWYPEDNYVDWWGINYLTVYQMSSGDNFVNDAALHLKPVMICEACPIHNGGTTNGANWNDWFVPLFNKIRNTPHIKAFIFISDPWDRGPLSHWSDSRINNYITAVNVLQNYKIELESSMYLHMVEYLNNPQIIPDNPLPVMLSHFDVKVLMNSNMIRWETESEINNFGFNLYRAADRENQLIEKLNFTKINLEIIPGAGTTSVHHCYSFSDKNVEFKMHYWYLLEDVDYNGLATKHEIIHVYREKNVTLLDSLYNNYPNPFNCITTIEYQLYNVTPVQFKIYSVLGELVYQKYIPEQVPGKYKITWNGRNLFGNTISSGIYICIIQTKSGTKYQKMVLTR